MNTLLFHDFESWSPVARQARPSQWAAVRTNYDLEPVGEPIILTCALDEDYVPSPIAAAITGLTPQSVADGLREPDFFGQVNAAMSVYGTCATGYNSGRYDDELARFGFWRNLIAPYAREYGQERSRWDVINLVRAAYALTDQDMNWRMREDDLEAASFKLSDIMAANGIEHDAHDALGDVWATIEVVRLVKRYAQALLAYALTLRDKRVVSGLLDPERGCVMYQVAPITAARHKHLTPIVPLGPHPRAANLPRKKWGSVLALDLRYDPSRILDEDADHLRELMFTHQEADVERIGAREIRFNNNPFVLDAKRVRPAAIDQAGLDPTVVAERLAFVNEGSHREELLAKLHLVFDSQMPPAEDADLSLYDGFIGFDDAPILADLSKLRGKELAEKQAGLRAALRDPRLRDLALRYVARFDPDMLTSEERLQWEGYRRERVLNGKAGFMSLKEARAAMVEVEQMQGVSERAARDTLEWAEATYRELVEVPEFSHGSLPDAAATETPEPVVEQQENPLATEAYVAKASPNISAEDFKGWVQKWAGERRHEGPGYSVLLEQWGLDEFAAVLDEYCSESAAWARIRALVDQWNGKQTEGGAATAASFTFEREGDGRYRVKTAAGYLGTVVGRSGCWLADGSRGSSPKPRRTRAAAANDLLVSLD